MSVYQFTIPGRLPSLNEYIADERKSRFKAAKLKSDTQRLIMASIRLQLRGVRIKAPVWMTYTWFVRDKRSDRDNVAFARKFVQDALVDYGVLSNDGWNDVIGFTDNFEIDKQVPRVEVTLEER